MPNPPNLLNKIHVSSITFGSPPWFSKEKVLKKGGKMSDGLENITKYAPCIFKS